MKPTSRILPTFTLLFILLLFSACKPGTDDPEPEGNLIFKVQVDPNQDRYDSFGNISTVPSGRAAQSPVFNSISAHVIELTPNALTLPGSGAMVYQGEETTAGGDNAVDFDQASVVAPGEVIYSIPLKDVPTGTYPYVRVSVTYQNYDVTFNALGGSYQGTIASFVGFNTYITDFLVKNNTVSVNDNKAQGYWAFESLTGVVTGEAPAGATTVPNPLAATSPIPVGSCLVTGNFEAPLTITGDETDDVTVVLSFSTNQSFEWIDGDGNGTFDPLNGDAVIDMGLRGLIARVE